MVIRYAKIVLVGMLAAFAALAAFNNLTDYNSNFYFVQHVLSMDTTFPGNAAMNRAVNAPWLWHGAYWVIIAGEALTAVLLAGGALLLWRARQGRACQGLFCRGPHHGAGGVVLWLHGDRRGVVSDVAIAGVERPERGVQVLCGHSWCAGVSQSARYGFRVIA